jgi:glycosyltransferase involved in cell wall biosynthesis
VFGIRTALHRAASRLRDRLRGRLAEIRATAPAVPIIARGIAPALGRRIRRSARRDSPLRIGIDIRPFYEPLTGIGWYLHHLLDHFSRRDDVELILIGDPVTSAAGPRLHVALPAPPLTFDFGALPLTRYVRPLATAGYLALLAIERCDVHFGANYFLPRLVGSVARRRVVTVHDLTYRRMPHLLQAETLENLHREMTREIERADAVICVSEATRRDLLASYEIDPRRAITIHSGLEIASGEREPVARLPERYVLFVSTIEPRKNLDTLVTAFEMLRDSGAWDGELVVVGKIGWKSESTVRRMRTSRWRAAIHHLDYLSRGELATVYEKGEIFVLPSHYEGFGFPLLEAMAWGVPSIAARSSSLPEVGGDAALYFDPTSPEELAGTIARLAADPALRRELAQKGRARAAEFRWEEAAERTLEVLRRVGEEGR